MVLVVKKLPASAGDSDSVPGWEDPPEEEMATHSSVLAWRIPWTEEPGRLPSKGLKSVGHKFASDHAHITLLSLAGSVM